MYHVTTNFEKFHEKEEFELYPKVPLSVKKLRDVLTPMGFEEDDDFFTLYRDTKLSPWQSEFFVTIDVLDDDGELYMDDDSDLWTKINISYLFAELPFQLYNQFLSLVFNISERLKLTVYHKMKFCTIIDLERMFLEYREDVRTNLGGEPGSEIVTINIQNSYPRQNKE